MTDTTLRRRVAGRAIRPCALAVSLATAVIAYATAGNIAVGELLDDWPGHIISIMAIIAVVMLWGGWWGRSDTWMTRGLLWSAGVWAGVGTVLTIETGAWVSAALAWCWCVASGGAWLLEHEDVKRRRGVR